MLLAELLFPLYVYKKVGIGTIEVVDSDVLKILDGGLKGLVYFRSCLCGMGIID